MNLQTIWIIWNFNMHEFKTLRIKILIVMLIIAFNTIIMKDNKYLIPVLHKDLARLLTSIYNKCRDKTNMWVLNQRTWALPIDLTQISIHLFRMRTWQQQIIIMVLRCKFMALEIEAMDRPWPITSCNYSKQRNFETLQIVETLCNTVVFKVLDIHLWIDWERLSAIH